MNLEDHAGDVCRKGRLSANVSLDAAAQAAGVSSTELSAFEDAGATTATIDFAALGRLAGIDGAKLARLAAGWTPSQIDLGRWHELQQVTTAGDDMTTNCYLVWDEATREAALFDTGFDATPVFALIEKHGLDLKHLFFTHSHHDHMAAMGEVRKRVPKVKLHSDIQGVPVDQRNRRNDFIMLGSLRITNRETPGHSEDGVTYVVGNWPDDAPHVAIVGDAIFCGSIGRGNQSWDLARQKVREQIFSLPVETLICPGHGPVTTVATEKENNPFF
jgi:hydroxyacylglutathione hydrolase